MAKSNRNKLAAAVLLSLIIGVSGAAQAGDDSERSSTWALGNMLLGLATAMNGEADAGALQVSEAVAETERETASRAQTQERAVTQASAAD